MSNVDINDITRYMAQAIEMLMSNNDPNASANEKIDAESAKAIASLGKNCIEGFKVKVKALEIISHTDNRELTDKYAKSSGIIPIEQKKLSLKE